MFEDNWPKQSNGPDNDLNDVVIEYDLKVTECQVENLLPAHGYKEGLLLTLDLRAKGGYYPTKLGVELIGLDKKYINEITSRILWKGGQGMEEEMVREETGGDFVEVRVLKKKKGAGAPRGPPAGGGGGGAPRPPPPLCVRSRRSPESGRRADRA